MTTPAVWQLHLIHSNMEKTTLESRSFLDQSEALILREQLTILKLQMLVEMSVPQQTDSPQNRIAIAEKLQIPTVKRRPLSLKSWEPTSWHASGMATVKDTAPELICVAATLNPNNETLSCHFLNMSSSSESSNIADVKLKVGSHVFVKVPGERHLRVALGACPFGHGLGHRQLAKEQPVLYAGACTTILYSTSYDEKDRLDSDDCCKLLPSLAVGEIDIGENMELVRWNNMSGTYQCSHDMAFQVRSLVSNRRSYSN